MESLKQNCVVTKSLDVRQLLHEDHFTDKIMLN